jgi:hypothetical protein
MTPWRKALLLGLFCQATMSEARQIIFSFPHATTALLSFYLQWAAK